MAKQRATTDESDERTDDRQASAEWLRRRATLIRNKAALESAIDISTSYIVAIASARALEQAAADLEAGEAP